MKDAIKTACNIKDIGSPFLYCPNNVHVLIFLNQGLFAYIYGILFF